MIQNASVCNFIEKFSGTTPVLVSVFDKFGEKIFPALEATVRGTGGALTVSMLTTSISMLTLVLGQFGQVLALSILFAHLASILVTPSVFVAWDDLT